MEGSMRVELLGIVIPAAHIFSGRGQTRNLAKHFEQPVVIEEGMRFAQTWANNLSDEVIAKMREELKKRGLAQ